MIQATHLRIGNIVDSPEGFVYVHSIAMVGGEFFVSYLESPFDSKHKGVLSLSEISPIPLSPDILEKCGFECTSKGHYKKRNMGELYLKHSPQAWLVKMYPATPLTSVKHVHQLMNLYFVITGEELTLNL